MYQNEKNCASLDKDYKKIPHPSFFIKKVPFNFFYISKILKLNSLQIYIIMINATTNIINYFKNKINLFHNF